MVTPTVDVLVIGGGVIGLSVAFHLLKREPRLKVTLVDAAPLTSGERGQASFAAAGMLAPFAESHSPGPFFHLGVESLRRYPEFIDSIHETAGTDGDPLLQITGAGMLRLARNAAEAERLESLYDWQRALDFGVERLTGDEARQREPALTDRAEMALYSPQERQIDPRRLRSALSIACRRLGAEIIESAEANFLRSDYRNGVLVTGINMPYLHSRTLVFAGGAWTGLFPLIRLPVAPVKGQILAVDPRTHLAGPLRHTLYAPDIYLVPRPEGRIIVGATEEPEAGFDTHIEANVIENLRQRAVRLVPSLADAPLDGPAWAGLRPGTPDGLPILGPHPDCANAFVASGHFRNGILLTPITGHLIAEAILRPGSVDAELKPFLPNRFLETTTK